ncbi:MAG: TlpA disulfide reductase family protein [Myxococcota bacterium]
MAEVLPSRPEEKPMAPLLAATIALGVLLGLVVVPRLAPAGGSGHEARPAPNFTLPVVANQAGDGPARLELSSLKEKVVILDFWASWCGPCRMQAPILDRIQQRHGEQVVVLGINVDDPPAVAKRYAEREGLSYPILLDTQGEAQQLYGATTLPTVVIIDREGVVRQFTQGVIRESAIEKVLSRL